jgi:hypothetical protein
MFPAKPQVEHDGVSISVVDTRGDAVLSLSLRRSDSGKRCLVLAGERNKQIFAIATETENTGTITIADRINKAYATFQLGEVWVSGSIFVLQTSGGQKFSFRKDAKEGTMHAVAQDGRMMACIDPSDSAAGPHGPSRTLIIGPSADAGLFVLCLLCSDMMTWGPDRR